MATIKLEIQADSAADLAAAVQDVAASYAGNPLKAVAQHTPAPKAAAPAKEAAKSKAPEPATTAAEKPATSTEAPSASTAASGSTQTEPAPAADGKQPTQAEFQKVLVKVMQEKSAKVVQQVLQESCGTGVPPQVKPEQYATAIAALEAALKK